MHPISNTLATMVKRAAAKARRADQMRSDSHDFERAVYRALTELDRTRPRLVAFAPEEALKRVLARPDVRHHLGVREARQPAPARFALARPWRDAEWHRPERRANRQDAAIAAMRAA
jgi:hypothetical protein